MKYAGIYTLFFMFISFLFCKGQNKTKLPTDHNKAEAQDVITPNAPKYIVRNIKQDRHGNIWIAAFDGIFRYDGKSFTNITSKVRSARFFSVLEDRKGNFWFGTVGEDVYYYDGASFQHFTTVDGLANNGVIDIYEDDAGKIWFGTGSGASRYNGTSFQNYRMKWGLPDNNDTTLMKGKTWKALQKATTEGFIDNDVNSIIEDKTGKFWFGTRGNAYIYDGKTFNALPHGSTFINVRKVMEDRQGNIWLGGRDGLWRYNGSTWTNFTTNFVGYVYEDRKGNIWTSSETAQGWTLSRYDEKSLSDKKPVATEIQSAYEVNKKMVFGILEANDGSIWFGSLDGVYRYDGKTIIHY